MADDGVNDKVELRLDNDRIFISTGYEIRQSVLQQPGEFSLRLGQGSENREAKNNPYLYSNLYVADLLAKYKPNRDFQLRIDGKLRMSGKTDGYRASSSNGATEVTIFGRDALAPLHDSHIDNDQSFTNDTYKSLVQKVFTQCGLNPSLIDFSDAANASIMAGVPIKNYVESPELDELIESLGSPGEPAATAPRAQAKSLDAKIGMRWLDFLRRQLDRAGLFLWAAANGRFVLSTPSTDQSPTYQLVRQRGSAHNLVSVVHADLLYDTRPMFSYGIVYGRGGGRAKGRHKSKGDSTDHEMLDLGFDNRRTLVIRDNNSPSISQAAYLATRKLAEARRHGYQLVYTVAGHTSLPSFSSTGVGAPEKAVWTPNTIVNVIDDEFGIRDDFWIESCEFRRQPQATTTLRLMRKKDVLFGEADFAS